MKIKGRSFFKGREKDTAWFRRWVQKLETHNGRRYTSIHVATPLGNTQVWAFAAENATDTLVIFPGARTTALFWDFDKGLDHLGTHTTIFLVETNGLPNLSDGDTPDIHSLDYGVWATEVLRGLNIDKAFIAGASFGGLICMKLALVSPEKIKAAFLLNPGCLQPFSMSLSNLYYNILPIVWPSKKNIQTFLDKAVFCKPTHQLSETCEKLIIDYEWLALNQYKDRTQKPYYMGEELKAVTTETYLLEGDRDLLFPYQKSISNARKYISSLKEVRVFQQVGHGIETYDKALQYIAGVIQSKRMNN